MCSRRMIHSTCDIVTWICKSKFFEECRLVMSKLRKTGLRLPHLKKCQIHNWKAEIIVRFNSKPTHTWSIFKCCWIVDVFKFNKEAVPKVFWARTYTVCSDKVADETKHLEKQGILEKIKYSECEAQIVHVIRPDGSVRFCRDYKVIVNSCCV